MCVQADAESAIELINFAYFKKVRVQQRMTRAVCSVAFILFCVTLQVATKPRKKQRKNDEEEADGEDSRKRSRKGASGTKATKKLKLKPGDPGYDPYDFTSDEEEEEDVAPTFKSRDRGGKSHDQEDDDTMETDQSTTRAVSLTEAR